MNGQAWGAFLDPPPAEQASFCLLGTKSGRSLLRIAVWGVSLEGGVIQKLRERQTGQNKWTDEQHSELTRQLRYGCGMRREFHIFHQKT